MAKKTLAAIAVMLSLMTCSIAFNGCVLNDEAKQHQSCTAAFNEEQYVWQDFLFPTNRTSGRQ